MTAIARTALLALVALLLATCGGDDAPKVLSGYVLTPPPSVAALSLPDVSDDGANFPFVAAEGRLLIVYFGYTY